MKGEQCVIRDSWVERIVEQLDALHFCENRQTVMCEHETIYRFRQRINFQTEQQQDESRIMHYESRLPNSQGELDHPFDMCQGKQSGQRWNLGPLPDTELQ